MTDLGADEGSTPPRMRLVVLFGGRSAEHDVSCVSARELVSAVDTDRFEIAPVGIGRDGTWMIADDTTRALARGDALPRSLPAVGEPTTAEVALARTDTADLPTVVFPLLHGPNGEDGSMQGLLELLDVPYVGSGVLGSSLCMDKIAAKEMTAAHGIAQAEYRAVHIDDVSDEWRQSTAEALGLPVFVKPANLGSSVGVSRAATAEEFAAAVATAGRYDEWIVVEEAIDGREIECAVLGNRTLECSLPGEIIPGDDFYSYNDKYEDGVAETRVPADLTPEQTDEVRALAIRAAGALRVDGLARVDFFFEEDRGFLLNEINTMPGFTPISMYPQLWEGSGLSYTDLITRLAELALERHARRARHRSVER